MVPQQILGDDNAPIQHGIVERQYDRLREIVRRYVLDKQEVRMP